MKYLKLIVALASTAVVSGCMQTVPENKTTSVRAISLSNGELSRVQSAVRSSMKDPSSAQFGRYTAFIATKADGEEKRVVCGYVNGKNSYGGYVGMTPYIALGLESKSSTPYVTNGPGEYYMSVCEEMYGVRI